MRMASRAWARGLLRAKKYTPPPSSVRSTSPSNSGFAPDCGSGISNGPPSSMPKRLIFPIVSLFDFGVVAATSPALGVVRIGVSRWHFCPWHGGRGGRHVRSCEVLCRSRRVRARQLSHDGAQPLGHCQEKLVGVLGFDHRLTIGWQSVEAGKARVLPVTTAQ